MSGKNYHADHTEESTHTLLENSKILSARIANPTPAACFAFASTTFILSMYNVNVRGIREPNLVLGMAIFSGGLLQFIAGMWQFPRGDVFSATVFSTYGCFWMSYAAIFIPASGILAAYESDSNALANALGVYLITWFMVTCMFILGSLRKSIALVCLLSALATAFALLSAAQFAQSISLTRAGGAAGIATSILAYYVGVSEMLASDERPILKLPLGTFGSGQV